jgi:hypothetical protein
MTEDGSGGEDIDEIDTRQPDPALAQSLPIASGLWGAPTPVFVPSKSSPLEEDTQGEIPPAALWAMKYRRHFHFGSRSDTVFRTVLGDESDPVYILDDGAKHHMVGRQVGVDQEGLKYFLIGRITMGVYEHFAIDGADIAGIFDEADDLCLCSVYEATEGPSNVLLVRSYEGIDQVPGDYVPPNPLIQFADHLPGEE